MWSCCAACWAGQVRAEKRSAQAAETIAKKSAFFLLKLGEKASVSRKLCYNGEPIWLGGI